MSGQQKLVRLAILGSGIFAKEAHLPAIAELTSQVTLVANWSRSEASAKDFQKHAKDTHNLHVETFHGEDGLETLLNGGKIDAVIIALPITSQPEKVIQCLKSGKHVLSEKPIAETVKRAQGLVAQYEADFQKQGLIWEIAEQFYHEPRYKRVKEILDSGKLGKITYFTQTVFNHMAEGSKYHATQWRTVPDYQGGFLLDGGTHFAAGLAAMFGPIDSVFGLSSLTWDHLAPKDTVAAVCRTKSGINGTLTMSMGAAPTLRQLETIVSCEKGHLTLQATSDQEGGWKLTTYVQDREPETEMFPSRGIFHEVENFAQRVQRSPHASKSASSMTTKLALRDLAFIQACVNDTHKWTKLDELIQ